MGANKDEDKVDIPIDMRVEGIDTSVVTRDLKKLSSDVHKALNSGMRKLKLDDDSPIFDTSGIKSISKKFYKAMYGIFKLDDAVDDSSIKDFCQIIQSSVKNSLKGAFELKPSEYQPGISSMARAVDTEVGSAMNDALDIDKRFDIDGLAAIARQIRALSVKAIDDQDSDLYAKLGKAETELETLAQEYERLEKVKSERRPERYAAEVVAMEKLSTAEMEKQAEKNKEIEQSLKNIKNAENQIKQLTSEAANEEIRYSQAVQKIELASRGSASATQSKIQMETDAHQKRIGQISAELNAQESIVSQEKQKIQTLNEEVKVSKVMTDLLAEHQKQAKEISDRKLDDKRTLETDIKYYNKRCAALTKELGISEEELGVSKQRIEAEERIKELQSQISAKQASLRMKQEEAQELRRSTAQFYYRLRAIKMLDHALREAEASLDRFIKKSVQDVGKITKLWFKLATPFGLISGALKKATDSLKSFNKEAKKTTKSHNNFLGSMKKGLWTIIRYSFGIRSLYFLFNKLRRAMGEGFENLAKQFSEVNVQLSSLLTSVTRMKNSVAAMVQPLLNVLAPALEKISELFDELSYKIASFFAALTGQNYVYRAIRYQMDYVESLEKTKKKAKEAKKELSNLDKLNVLTTHKDNDDEDPVAEMFKKVPIDATLKDWLKKIKDFLKPITNAWAKEAEFVKNAWKYAWDEIVKLSKDIWRDFLKVWFEPETERIFENVFHIIGDIGLVVGNLAKNFRKAWNFDDNGYRILKAIRDIILSITERLREAADYTVKWSKKLNFIPMMTTLANVLNQQVVPAVDKILALFVKLYEEVLLEILRYFIEDLSPILLRIIGNLVEAIGDIADNFRIAWQEGGTGRKIVEAIENIITDIAKVIEEATKQTKKWAKTLNFRPLLRSVQRFLVKIRPLVQRIAEILGKLWTDVLLPIWKDFTEKVLPKLIDALGEILGKIDLDQLSKTAESFFGLIKAFWDKYGEIMLSVVTKIADKLVELINSGTLDEILQKATDIVNKIDPEKAADLLLKIGLFILNGRLLIGVLSKITGALTNMWTVINFIKQADMVRKLGAIAKDTTTIKNSINDMQAAKAAAELGKVAAEGSSASSSLLGIIGPSALAAAALAVVVGAIITLWLTNEDFRGAIATMWEEIVATFKSATADIVESINTLGFEFDDLADAWMWFCDKIAPLFVGAADKVKVAIQGLIDSLAGVIAIIAGLANTLFGLIETVAGAVAYLFDDEEMITAGTERLSEGVKTFGKGVAELVIGVNNVKSASDDLTISTQNTMGSVAKMGGWYLDGKNKMSNYKQESENLNKTQLDAAKKAKILEEEFTILNGSYIDAEGNALTYKEAMEQVNQKMQETSSSVEGISTAITEMPDSMSPELRQSIEDMNEQIKEMDGNFDNVDVEKFTTSMNTAIPEATTQASTAMENLQTTAEATVPALTQAGEDSAKGYSNGLSTGLDVATAVAGGKIGMLIFAIKKILKIGSPSKVFDSIGQDTIQGLINGIKTLSNSAVNAIIGVANAILNRAKSALSPSKFISIGKNLISGLAQGIKNSMNVVTGAVSSMANSVVNKAKSLFKVHSPSVIFEDIGEMLDVGLAVGVEDNTDEVDDAFEDMVPDNKFLEAFYEKFISMLSNLKQDAVNIISSMTDEIEAIISRMSNLAMLEDISTQLSNVSNIKVPDIAVGYKLPDNERFSQQQSVDLSALPNMLKNAFISALDETGALQNNDGDTIIELDGHEIFRVMKDENTKYKKQTGRSAFA